MTVELNPITSGYSTGLINDNFQLVEDELNNNVLRRDGLSSGGANHMEVNLDMNGNAILNVSADITDDGSLLNLGAADLRYVEVAGDTMSGVLSMGGNSVTNLPVPTQANEAARKSYVDSGDSQQVSRTGDSMSGDLDMDGNDVKDIRTTITDNLILGGLPVSPGELNPNQVIWVDTIADLQALPPSELVDGQQAVVRDDGLYYWSAADAAFKRQRKTATGRSATVIVAAHNSDERAKREADYVCDGVDDQIELRQATSDALTLYDALDRYSEDPVIPYGDFPCVWFDGAIYHAYYGYAQGVGHATSADLRNWTDDTDNNPVIPLGPEDYDNNSAGVPVVWTEGTDWFMLYRGNGSRICLATGTDGVNWSKSAANPVVDPAIFGFVNDPPGLIKVGSTYHMYTNNVGGNRMVSRFTSTDLTSWALADACIFDDRRYCSTAFKRGDSFYLLVSKDLPEGGAIELWRCSDPAFRAENRELVGTPVYDPTAVSIDTPSIVTDTIQRDTFPGNRFDMIWAKQASGFAGVYPGFLISEPDIDAAIAKCRPPTPGKVVLMPGTYTVQPGGSHPMQGAIVAQYGQIIEGNNSIITLPDNATSANTAIHAGTDSTIRDVTINGNGKTVSAAARACVSGVIENLRVFNMTGVAVFVTTGTAKNIVAHDINAGVNAALYIREKGRVYFGSLFNIAGIGMWVHDWPNAAVSFDVEKRAVVHHVSSEHCTGRAMLFDNPVDCRFPVMRHSGAVGAELRARAAGSKILNATVSDTPSWGILCAAPGSKIIGCELDRTYTTASSATHAQIGVTADGVRITDCITRESPASGASLRVTNVSGAVAANNDFDKGVSHTAGTLIQYNNVIDGTLVP